jgi:hypothetical protein
LSGTVQCVGAPASCGLCCYKVVSRVRTWIGGWRVSRVSRTYVPRARHRAEAGSALDLRARPAGGWWHVEGATVAS